MLDPILHTFPLWLVAVLVIAACLLMGLLGMHLRRRVERRAKEAGEAKSDARGYIISAIFGLLAFMLGLTFSIALDRYDGRRGLVSEEANAISTAYLRASLFDEPYASRLQAVLRAYAHSRIAPDGLWDERMDARLAQSLALRKRLWTETRAAVYPVRETEQASYFLEAVNDTLNIGIRRQLLGRAHIPTRIVDILLIYLLIASGVLGYLVAEKTGAQKEAAALLLTLFALMVVLILDLDRPRSGTIRIPQTALTELVAVLDQDAPPPRSGP